MSSTQTLPVKEKGWGSEGAEAKSCSGHESFACRHGWLVKLYNALAENPRLFANDEDAILTLGLGKNMVKSIRFWGQAFGLTRQDRGETVSTQLAHRLFDPAIGSDPYLEDTGSLWRLHWQITAHSGLGAWVIVFQDLLDSRITRDRLITLAEQRAATSRGSISRNTATAHIDIFLRT